MNFWAKPESGWWGRDERRHLRHGMRRMRRGILKFALLKLLDELPRHGYDLIRAVREHGWAGGPGSVYPLLAALEAAGLVTGRAEGDRRIYEITERGRELLGEHAAELEHFLKSDRFEEGDDEEEAAGDRAAQVRDSARRLMQSISQLGRSSKPETIERVCELLDQARKEIYKLLAQE